MAHDVFDRRRADGAIISAGFYNLIIGLTLCWGFAVNWFMVQEIDPQSIAAINPWIFYGGYFVSCLLGSYLFNSSSKPIVSFIGYNLVVIPFGFLVNLIVSNYDETVVVDAVRVTGIVTAVMMVLGTMFPAFFKKIGGALSIALLIVIVVELVEVFVFHMHHGVLDWIVVVIFCGYIGYDWGRANSIPKTVDNAIDSAASLYMDIINLFIRILRIMGRNR